jgi:hypothetical protein
VPRRPRVWHRLRLDDRVATAAHGAQPAPAEPHHGTGPRDDAPPRERRGRAPLGGALHLSARRAGGRHPRPRVERPRARESLHHRGAPGRADVRRAFRTLRAPPRRPGDARRPRPAAARRGPCAQAAPPHPRVPARGHARPHGPVRRVRRRLRLSRRRGAPRPPRLPARGRRPVGARADPGASPLGNAGAWAHRPPRDHPQRAPAVRGRGGPVFAVRGVPGRDPVDLGREPPPEQGARRARGAQGSDRPVRQDRQRDRVRAPPGDRAPAARAGRRPPRGPRGRSRRARHGVRSREAGPLRADRGPLDRARRAPPLGGAGGRAGVLQRDAALG